MNCPAGRDLSGPDVQSSNAPTGKVIDQEGDRIQPDPVLRQDYRCSASTLELRRSPEAADVSSPLRQAVALTDIVGTWRMWHRRDRRRPAPGRGQPPTEAGAVEEVVTPHTL